MFALLSRYLDMDLPPESCREIEAHLNGCAPCIDFVESLKDTINLCRRFEPAELPDPLKEDARRRLEDAYRSMLAKRGEE